MQTVYLSLGSNIGNREEALQRAIQLLDSDDLRIQRLSPVYETSPVGLVSQPWFLNMVVEAHTTLFPMRLLQRVLHTERKMGRRRSIPQGPRVIDIDILFHGNFVVETPQLKIPHPRAAGRRFVLEPLAELSPDLRHPLHHRTVRELLAATASQKVHKVAFQPEMPVRVSVSG
ncbi:MAG TPA: 2-amino-4-hydroxy-6-hydroxymethyldihydropteridine diphosphokinase [Bryobacteraceae bacterium]|nr:2-amino-4-hydroxy-6-hydroxymethyldihydropteridine diphosphokinase [Bryobacteraceae bacterium]